MGAVDDDGNGADYILMGGSEDCDIPEADLLPSDAGELETGKVYRGAVLSRQSKSEGNHADRSGFHLRRRVGRARGCRRHPLELTDSNGSVA
ncbi:hypothetical protein [Corynebacterium sp.]|uniref:hypothetical protein n=1 Tax=Corynebacterium sp. TaxID=1720 RepID=UPI0025BD87CD|nr:hypothetical protein [Corynebacterium sp.]